MKTLVEFYYQHRGFCTVAFGAAIHAAHVYLPKLWQAGKNGVARAITVYPALCQAGGIKTIISSLWSGQTVSGYKASADAVPNLGLATASPSSQHPTQP